jgi:isoamylase/glycogen operon protein
MKKYKTAAGVSTPLGVSFQGRSINFALFSQHAEGVTLCLFNRGEKNPYFEIPLYKVENVWSIAIEGLTPPFEYGYTIKAKDLDPDSIFLDPHAKELSSSFQWGDSKLNYRPRGIFRTAKEVHFDWEDDSPPQIPMETLILYEMHVRAFTMDPSSKCRHPGTYLGIVEKIPYLKELGINGVELMPIHEFNECEYQKVDPETKKQLYNFWGYSTVNFFSPMNRYAEKNAIAEFKTMVKELHKAGIEVILDVVYNHTCEGLLNAAPLSFKAIDHAVYYMLGEGGKYLDFTGTGNTLNCNHPAVTQMILDSLRYWVKEMHVDGFRFDLASIFTRAGDGTPLTDPPILKAIREDSLLANVKLISESWDAGGLYQVGGFPRWGRWSEWNGKFRDNVRRFLKGTDGLAGAFATALSGSQDLYGHYDGPSHSINFITAHDGFTLHDLVSYNEKHNEANGEENRDGLNENDSWNCGIEGPTKNRKILSLREKQVKNFQVALFLSLGVPMLLMGDELLHTRKGNNNTWCHDDHLNWIHWQKSAPHFFRFVKLLIHFRKHSPLFQRAQFLSNEEVDWHGHLPFQPDWSSSSRFVAYTMKSSAHSYYIAFNAHFHHAHLQLPPPPSHQHWYRMIDTSLHAPNDFVEHPKEGAPVRTIYELSPNSTLVLQSG